MLDPKIVTHIGGIQREGMSSRWPGLHFDTKAHAYQTLLDVAVAPGNTATSSLYTNISKGTMPRGRPKLSATLIVLVDAPPPLVHFAGEVDVRIERPRRVQM